MIAGPHPLSKSLQNWNWSVVPAAKSPKSCVSPCWHTPLHPVCSTPGESRYTWVGGSHVPCTYIHTSALAGSTGADTYCGVNVLPTTPAAKLGAVLLPAPFVAVTTTVT